MSEIEETRHTIRRKRRSSSKDPNKGERRWQEKLEELRKQYGEHSEESESEKTE